MIKPCKSIQQQSAASASQLQCNQRDFSWKVWVSHKSERCNQRGHSPWLPSLLPDAGPGASQSEGSPSKNISSNFHEMNSFGDAICLSIVRVPCAQVRSSYCSRHVSSLCSSSFMRGLITLFCFTSVKCPSVGFFQRFLAPNLPSSWHSAHGII